MIDQPRVAWLTQRGHTALPSEAQPATEALEHIYLELGGNLDVLRGARPTPLPCDFLHVQTKTLIELDESQHFTTARLRTLELYPPDVPLGFDLSAYVQLCGEWRRRSDGYRRTKPARGFGEHGRQKQRAYYDALRDLAAPAMGHPALIRVAAPDRNGHTAYIAHRDALFHLLG